jgi:hypothetical protein
MSAELSIAVSDCHWLVALADAYRASLKSCSKLPAIRSHKDAGRIGMWSRETCVVGVPRLGLSGSIWNGEALGGTHHLYKPAEASASVAASLSHRRSSTADRRASARPEVRASEVLHERWVDPN